MLTVTSIKDYKWQVVDVKSNQINLFLGVIICVTCWMKRMQEMKTWRSGENFDA
jgi:hypothetical protein